MLPPCPFCGGEPEVILDTERGYPGALAIVSCRDCTAVVFGPTPDDARGAWGRRTARAPRADFEAKAVVGIPPLSKVRADEDAEPFLPPAYPGVPDP